MSPIEKWFKVHLSAVGSSLRTVTEALGWHMRVTEFAIPPTTHNPSAYNLSFPKGLKSSEERRLRTVGIG